MNFNEIVKKSLIRGIEIKVKSGEITEEQAKKFREDLERKE